MDDLLHILEVNQKAHNDIEEEIQIKGNGLFVCELRINNGAIVDLTIIEWSSGGKYAGLEKEIIEKLTAAYRNQSRDTRDPFWSFIGERPTAKRAGKHELAPNHKKAAVQVPRIDNKG